MTPFCFMVNALCCAINVGLYVDNPTPVGLTCIVFSGMAALFFLVLAVTG